MRTFWRGLLVFLLLVIMALVFLTATDTGLRFAWRQLQPLLPVQVQIESLQGSLSGKLTLRGLVVQDEVQRLSVSRVHLDWSPAQLWGGVLHVGELSLDGLEYQQLAITPPASQTQQPFTLPQQIEIPLVLQLDRLQVNEFHFQGVNPEQTFDITRFESRVRLTRKKLRIEKLNVDAPLFTLSATADVGTGDGFPLAAEANLALHLAGYPELAGRLVAQGSIAEPELDANLTVNDTGKLQAQVRRKDDSIDALLDWTDIEWPGKNAGARSDSGHLQITGDLHDYRVSLQGAFDIPPLTNTRVRLAGRGNRQSLKLDELRAELLDGEVQGSAKLSWDPQVTGSVDLHASRLNPGVLLDGWSGRLNATLKSDIQVQAQGIAVQVNELSVSGSLRDYPVQLAARADYAAAQLKLDSFLLNSGPSRVSAAGYIGEKLDVTWDIQSSNLESLLPGASGKVSGTGSVRGALATPRVATKLEGRDLRYGANTVQKLTMNADLDLAGTQNSSFDVRLEQGRTGNTNIDTITLQGDGTPESNRLKLEVESSDGKASLVATGRLEPQHWAFELTRGSIQYPHLDAWSLQAPAKGEIGAQQVTVQDTCWVSDGATLCASGDWNPAQSQVRLRLERLPLAWLNPLLAENAELEGNISGNGEFSVRSGQTPSAKLRLASSAGRLLTSAVASRPEQQPEQQPEQGPLTLLAFKPGKIHFDMGRDGMELSASLPLEMQGGIEMQASVKQSDATLVERPLSGYLRTDIRDLNFLDKIIPQLSRVSGRLDGDAVLSGTLQAPQLKGKLALVDGAASVDAAGLKLTDISMQFRGTGDDRIQMKLGAVSGGGTLTVEGESRITAASRSARFDIKGDKFKLLDTPEAQVFVSPALKVAMKDKAINIEGEILVPEATIEPKKLPASAQAVSGDQVLIDEANGGAVAQAYQVTSRVRVVLGDKVRFDGFGLSGRFSGNVIARDEPLQPTTASGEIRIHDGKYKAYGQNLTIRTGRLLFVGGPVTEPGLDLEAVRTPAPNVLVGIRARGQLRQPDISVFSEPDMSQSDRLAWLVLGRPLETGSTTRERNSINQAAIVLGLGGGALLGKQVSEKIGVDDFSIEPGPGEATGQAALMVGKYLTPKLYIAYGIGIFDPVSTLRMRYTISSKWKLLGETSATSSGADLFYVIERGQ